ncbi:MAG: pallilysin-related adhesin [Treponema sp.]|jgi:hypothetical protein|nr:pallilysin-related adhesin [Treponema sp.]
MTKKALLVIAAAVFCSCAFLIVFFGFRSRTGSRREKEQSRTRIVIPRGTGGDSEGRDTAAERIARQDEVNAKAALADGEIIVALLTQDFDGDQTEEQIIAYRNLLEIESPVYIAYIDFDGSDRTYKRVWTAPTAATRPGTLSLFTQDLIGDRSVCIILTGMNGQGEHTMTIFRKNEREQNTPYQNRGGAEPPFDKIAELRIDGSIIIQETERSQAYQLGLARGQSFTIAAYGRDYDSANILDQVEITYAHNPVNGLYEQSKIARVPGSQIEQRRLRELLSGERGVFEEFINDLWYYVSPQGTVDNRQYIYFDPYNKELIFFGDEAQQVFSWQNSSPTRYGLYISSQNISVSTLRRFLDIELESLDSIRVKVFEDVRLKIGVNASWDGSYRRAAAIGQKENEYAEPVIPFIDALYDSSLGRVHFLEDGVYEIQSKQALKKGRYAFFYINGQELLELREDSSGENSGEIPSPSRELFRADGVPKTKTPGTPKNLVLSRIRLGAMGIQDLHEPVITLTPVQM